MERHSKIYRLVQRDEERILGVKKEIDGEGIRIENIDMTRIENIDMTQDVLVLIKGTQTRGMTGGLRTSWEK